MATFILLWMPWLIGILFWVHNLAKSLLDWLDLLHQPRAAEQPASASKSRYHWASHIRKRVLPAYVSLVAWSLVGLLLGYFTLRRH